MDKERTTDRKCCQNVKPTLKTVTLTLRSDISKMSQMGMPPTLNIISAACGHVRRLEQKLLNAQSGTGLELTDSCRYRLALLACVPL